MWQDIIGLVKEYFATSLNNIHVVEKYIKIFHDMAWNMF